MKDNTRYFIETSLPAPFYYDRERNKFLSGEREFKPEQLPLGFGSLSARSGGDPFDERRIDIKGQFLVQTVLNPVMLPAMYNWLEKNISKKLLDETADVMQEVYEEVDPNKQKFSMNDRGSHKAFGASLLRAEHPHVVLTTLGNCACLGVSVDGTLGWTHWDEKVAQFEFHNVDTDTQEVSLLAGLGHLAFKASQG